MCCVPLITTVTWLCALVLSSGSGMVSGTGTKMSRRLEAICVANESLREYILLLDIFVS